MSNISDDEYADYRRRRVQRLKKIIVGTIISLILIPTIAAIVMTCLYVGSNKKLKSLQNEYDELLQTMEQLRDNITYTDEVKEVYSVSEVTESERDTSDSDTDDSEDASDENDIEGMKKIYLTFDDGPSAYTSEILDILNEYDIKATFFVVGKDDETSVEAYKRIVEEGHTLGMHSFSHRYSSVYASQEAFAEDLTKLQEYLYDVTGVWSRYYRFPGGSSNTASKVDMQELIAYLDEQDICYYDWNIVSGDAVGYTLSADTIYSNCVSKIDKYDNAVILMHDSLGKHTTVEALPGIIENIQARGDSVFLAITDDTEPVQHESRKDN